MTPLQYAIHMLRLLSRPLIRPWYRMRKQARPLRQEELDAYKHEADAAIEALRLELKLLRDNGG